MNERTQKRKERLEFDEDDDNEDAEISSNKEEVEECSAKEGGCDDDPLERMVSQITRMMKT